MNFKASHLLSTLVKQQNKFAKSTLLIFFSIVSFSSSSAYSQALCDVIYVDASTAGNDANTGSSLAPVKTLSKAISLAIGTRNHIKMTNGSYTETSIIDLKSDLVIEGRFTNTAGVWSKSSNTSSSTNITFSGTETISSDVAHVMGLRSNAKNNWKLIDLNLVTVDAIGQTVIGNGKSNYAVYIANGSSNYEITSCSITSGNASNGKNGTNGGKGANGTAGGGGLTGSNANDESAISGGIGGNGGNNIWGGNGGAGGRGGNVTSHNRRSRGCNGSNGQDVTITLGGNGGTSPGLPCQDNYGNSADKQNGELANDNATQGNNGYSYFIGVTAPNSHTLVNYFIPSNQAAQGGHGSGGGAGAGGGSSSGEWHCTFCYINTGNSGGGGGGGGGGGQGGYGGYGGGGSFGIYIINSNIGLNFNNNNVNVGIVGSGGNGGVGGAGGTRGGAGSGNSTYANNRAISAAGQAGKNGGSGGRGQDAANGINGQLVVDGIISSPSAPISNSPIITLNQLSNNICQNSVLNVTTSAASWILPANWEFVKYNNTAVASEFAPTSTTADITTTNTTGFYDITANGVVFNSYLNVRSARTLPVITTNPVTICAANNFTLAATAWGTETEYKWEIFSAADASNKGSVVNLIYSSSLAQPVTSMLTNGTYIIRYQVKEQCCGWSIPVFKTITVNSAITPAVAISTPALANICLGTTLTFTASPTNGGGTPSYQWKVNSVNAGANSATFQTSTLANSDVVSCEMTSNSTSCLTSATAISNQISVSLPIPGAVLSATEMATCLVNGNDWVRFYAPTGHLLGAVNAQNKDLGNVLMNTYVTAPQVMTDCSMPANQSFHTVYMGRTWVMTSSAFANGVNFPTNVSVRLPYNNSELTALNTTAETVTTGNPFDGGIASPANITNMMLTKITGNTENGIANSADCVSTIRGINAIAASGTNIYGTTSTQFLDFSVAQFSEFFLHKNFNNSPLPVTLTNFSATCNEVVTLSWTTASEKNADRFVIEKSRDGLTWTTVAEQTAAGNSNTIRTYNQIYENTWNGVTYYRLRQVDFNGDQEFFGPISVSCEANESSLTVYPNPNNGSFTVEISTKEKHPDAFLYLTDMLGKIITSQNVNLGVGTTQIMMDHMQLQKGTYLLTLKSAVEALQQPVKVLVK